MRSLKFFLLLSLIAAAVASPAFAQFSIVVQQNGQALSVSNGATITLAAPAVGQSATATVTLTYLGADTANFASAGQVVGTGFSVSGAAAATTLTALQSVSFTLQYTAAAAAEATGQFAWLYSQVNGATTVANGEIAFALVGTAPNPVVGQVTTGGGFSPITSGGTVQFTTTSVTIGIQNAGSGPATVNSISVTGTGFQIASLPLLPVTLPAGNQLNFTINFTATTTGTATGALAITFATGSFNATLSATSGLTGSSSLVVGQGSSTTGYTAVAPGGTFLFTNTIVNSASTITVGIYNPTSAAITLNSITVTGAAFLAQGLPLLPISLPSGGQLNITVQFLPPSAGPQTGTIVIASSSGSYTGNLSGTGISPPAVGYLSGGVVTTVSPGGTFQFGSTTLSSPTTLVVSVQNNGTATSTINSIAVAGAGYSVLNMPVLPLTLPAGGQLDFTIQFLPTTAGAQTGSLLITFANGTYSAVLLGTTVSSALPAYSFTGASGAVQPFTQPAIGLSLSSPYAADIAGTLTLTVTSDYYATDPAVEFSTGSKTVAFTIPANTLNAIFPDGTDQIQLQTGTVAGAITITPAFTVGSSTGLNITPSNPAVLQLTVPAVAPTLLGFSYTPATTTSFSLVISGYTTTRFLSQMTFQFTPRSGAKLTTTSVTVDLSGPSTLYFESASSSGGQFTVTIPFTLGNGGTVGSGTDLTQSIASIAVTTANTVGSSNSLTVTVP